MTKSSKKKEGEIQGEAYKNAIYANSRNAKEEEN
jgi:hypothetical protein